SFQCFGGHFSARGLGRGEEPAQVRWDRSSSEITRLRRFHPLFGMAESSPAKPLPVPAPGSAVRELPALARKYLAVDHTLAWRGCRRLGRTPRSPPLLARRGILHRRSDRRRR